MFVGPAIGLPYAVREGLNAAALTRTRRKKAWRLVPCSTSGRQLEYLLTRRDD